MKRKRGPVYATYRCPTCGRGGLAVHGDGKGNTVLHHNACGHWENVNIPFQDFVERGIAEGQLRELWNPDAKSKEGCFVATAVYRDNAAPEVMILRRYRDEVLHRFAIGRIFIKAYYGISPPIALAIGRSPLFSKLVRSLLDPLIRALDKHR